MPSPLPPDVFGSLTPSLEGAPRTQSHAARTVMAEAPLLQEPSLVSTEIGGKHDTDAGT